MIFWGGIIVCMYVHAPCYGGSFEIYYQASGGVVVVNGHWNPQFSIKPTQTDTQTDRQTQGSMPKRVEWTANISSETTMMEEMLVIPG